MARLKAIIAIILLVGLGEFARDLTKCVVYKENSNMVLTKSKWTGFNENTTSYHQTTARVYVVPVGLC